VLLRLLYSFTFLLQQSNNMVKYSRQPAEP
jgi:hypothetical protein